MCPSHRSERKVQQLLLSAFPSILHFHHFYSVRGVFCESLGWIAVEKVPFTGTVDFNVTLTTHRPWEGCFTKTFLVSWKLIHTCMHLLPRKAVLVFQHLQPPETLLAEFLDTGFGAGAAGWGRRWHGLYQSGGRHIILPLQSLYNFLEASLLLSEIMFNTVEERVRSKGQHERDALGALFELKVVSHQIKFIYTENFYFIWGRKKEKAWRGIGRDNWAKGDFRKKQSREKSEWTIFYDITM